MQRSVKMLILSFDEKKCISKAEKQKALVVFMAHSVVQILGNMGKGVVWFSGKTEGACL